MNSLINIIKAIKSGLKAFWALTGTIPYLRYILLGSVLVTVIVIVIIGRSCGGDSELENKIEQKQGETITYQSEANTAANTVEQKKGSVKGSRVDANAKTERATEVRTEKVSNVAVEEANKARCVAYPESKDCL